MANPSVSDGVAATRPGRGSALTVCRTLVEGVHFDLLYINATELGRRAAVVALTQLIPREGKPQWLVVTLGTRQDTHEFFVGEFFRGVELAASPFKAKIAAVQTIASPQAVLAQVTVLGEGPAKRPTRRPKPGDILAVTGSLGGSAAGLNCLKKIGRHFLDEHEEIVQAHLTPPARLDAASILWKGGASAVEVLTEGLAKDLHRLAERESIGATIDEEKLPIADTTRRGAELVNANPKLWALYGGEDYELLVSVPSARLATVTRGLGKLKVPLTPIGQVRAKRDGIHVRDAGGGEVTLAPQGWHDLVRRFRKTGQGE